MAARPRAEPTCASPPRSPPRIATGPLPPHRRTHEVRLAPLDLPTLASSPTGLAAGENAAATAVDRARPALHQPLNPLALVPTKPPGPAITSMPRRNVAGAAQHRRRPPPAVEPPPQTVSSRSMATYRYRR
ncbi:transcriptional-regulating factor 1-like isoform X1 [Panicum virgatum]|uniref:transcriptional-regulating factor 1-like isoform X1 n=1 Tax=Panicum virgatum TaxID=38727 RepID=UPI0019D59093|nr:transcriptional-regulating factor 1-like isoform X1 [Panicum virgatum]